MKKIVTWVKEFVKEDFHLLSYLWFACFILGCFVYNYAVNFEDDVLDPHQGSVEGVLFFFLFYAFAWFGTSIPKVAWNNKRLFSYSSYWIKSSFILLVLATASGMKIDWRSLFPDITSFDFYTLRKVLNYAMNASIVFGGSALIYLIYKDKSTRLYGFTAKNFNLKPYLGLLALMFPLLLWASFQPSFLEQYPNYRPWNYTSDSQQQLLGTIAYLTSYALDFIEVEFLFRGLLVIGVAQVIGKEAILPMVAVYAFLHFGKPMPEALGSIFGGYILGVISYRGQSILGGIIVHVGIAFLMELLANIQHLFLMP